MTDYITGEKFKTIADYQYAPGVKNGEDYDNLQNSLDINKLKDFDIIYTHTFYVKQLFDVISRVDKKLIIITHNSDQNIDDSYIVPDNVVRWFAQNVNVISPKIESIPIGLENNRWFLSERKKEKMAEKYYKERMHMKNLVYINHNVANNPVQRGGIYELFQGKGWATIKDGRNGHAFDNYLDNVYNHKYMICPEGNGMDTHRTWECLYMGTIPIEKRNINNAFHADMPILLVDDWKEITEKYLLEIWPVLFCNRNKKKLNFEYWKCKIHYEVIKYRNSIL